MWDERYAEPGYAYGTEPNDFLVQAAHHLAPGPVLCLAEGQGRNAVFLAGRGHPVTAVDQSAVGLEKARQLATNRGVALETVVADLSTYDLGTTQWAGIASIFCHLPPALRRRVHAAAVHALTPGGVFLLEAYTPAQLTHRTGGPQAIELLPTLEALQGELVGLEWLEAREIEREIHEGPYHDGLSAVVQLVGRKA